MSLSDDIFAAYDAAKLPAQPVRVFGRDLFIRHWSARTRAIWEGLVFDSEGKEKPTAKRESFVAAVVVCSLVDASGQPVFYRLTEADEKPMTFEEVVHEHQLSVNRVAGLSAVELERAFEVASKLNGLDKDTVGQAEKNSASPPS